jgi:hypothetical protein
MKLRSALLLFILLPFLPSAQELFPMDENASNVPKGVLGVRAFDETYQEVARLRNLFGIKLMYGLLPRLTIMATGTESNHHGAEFPPNLASHTHNGNKTTYSTGNFARGAYYPYQFNGFYLYAKYRFLSIDAQNEHFRMAAYGEWSNVNVAHDETEPDLLDDTKGYGGGLIATYLHKRIAFSLSGGFDMPGSYTGMSPDVNGGADIQTELFYGSAVDYHLSVGYLLFPRHYDNYNQTNINLYVEFMGKSYQQAVVQQYGGLITLPIQTPLLQAGNYVDIYPGIQAIIKSNLRIDASIGFPFINSSYAHFYPVYSIGIQRYFFFTKKPAATPSQP